MPTVVREAKIVAWRFGGRDYLDDLQGWGAFGLVQAAQRFEPERGVPFEAYARRRIRGAMLDGLRREGRDTHREEPRSDEEEAWAPERTDDPCPETQACDAQHRAIVRDAVDDLPAPEDELVRRHLLEGEALADTAKAVGLSASRAAQLLNKAQRRLAVRLRGASLWS